MNVYIYIPTRLWIDSNNVVHTLSFQYRRYDHLWTCLSPQVSLLGEVAAFLQICAWNKICFWETPLMCSMALHSVSLLTPEEIVCLSVSRLTYSDAKAIEEYTCSSDSVIIFIRKHERQRGHSHSDPSWIRSWFSASFTAWHAWPTQLNLHAYWLVAEVTLQFRQKLQDMKGFLPPWYCSTSTSFYAWNARLLTPHEGSCSFPMAITGGCYHNSQGLLGGDEPEPPL